MRTLPRVALRDLLKDTDIISNKLVGEEREFAKNFVRRRVRLLIDANPSFEDPGRPGDLTPIATKGVAFALVKEMADVRTALAAIRTRVQADVKKGLHLPVDRTATARVLDQPPSGNAASMRERLILSVVYQATAWDIRFAEPANLDRLHRLCDRRLRLVERMLYEVGRGAARGWKAKPPAAGPWPDGLARAFEYPRVPRNMFLTTCQPDAKDFCTAPMDAWHLGDDNTIVGPIQTNPGTTARWRPGTADPYALEFTPLDPAKPKAVDAISGLFTRSSDFLQRNLMYCDHTIHALHLEALVFAESKRRAAGDTAWLDGVVATKPAGWLRLYHPLVSPGALQPTQGKFLAGSGEPDFFHHIPVRPQELQVGDHLIVYNHPAYEHTTLHGAWRLENAVVVQTTPELLVQGHGSPIMSIASAKAHMLGLFLKALTICRAALRPLAKVTASAGSTAVKVDSTSAVRVGMKIDVIEAATETPIAQQRKVTRVDARAKTVEFDGAAVAATAQHALRRAHRPQFGGKFDSLFLASPTSANEIFLLRRVDRAASAFAPGSQDGDWHVAWVAHPREEKIRLDAKRAAFVKKQHFVDYTVEKDGAYSTTVGWFPLYEPVKVGGKPVLKRGKIVGIQPISIGVDNISAWTWFADPDANAATVPVIRPSV
jgi:hypothetical protein